MRTAAMQRRQGMGSAGAIITGVGQIATAVAGSVGAGLSYAAQNKSVQQQAEAARQQQALEAERIRLQREVAALSAQSGTAQAAQAARTQQLALLAGGFVMVAVLGVGAVILLRRSK